MAPVPGSPWKCVSRMTSLPPSPHTHKNVYEANVTLKQRIIETELPAFIYKCVSYYNKILLNNNERGIWQICPEYFLEQQEDVRTERNPLCKFLKEKTRYKKGNMVNMEDIRGAFSNWMDKKIVKLDNGTFGQVNKEYIVEILRVCKHCNQESRKGCCEKSNNKDRTKKTVVGNIEMIDAD